MATSPAPKVPNGSRVLSIQECDDLSERQDKIEHDSALIFWVLDHQLRAAPKDELDYGMPTIIRESLTVLAAEIRVAAREMHDILYPDLKGDD